MINKILEKYIHLPEKSVYGLAVRAAMKEFGDAVVDECAKEAEAIDGWNTGYSGSAASVDKDSILRVKKMIK